MKRKLSSPKMKVASIAVCTALLLTFGTTLAFADEAKNGAEETKNGIFYHSTDLDKTGSADLSEDVITATVMVKNENGVYYYSTDDGETWNEYALEDSNATAITEDTVETEDGTFYYTTNVGVSISEGATIGVYDITVYENDILKANSADFEEYEIDGNTFVKLRSLGDAAGFDVDFENDSILITTAAKEAEKYAVETENGIFYYSDGGEAPEDVSITITTKDGEDVLQCLVKIENGITYYSTDGGETWSVEAPEGFDLQIFSLTDLAKE